MFPHAPPALYSSIVGGAFVVGAVVFLLTAHAARIPLVRLLALQLGLAILGHLGGRLYLLIEFAQPWTWNDLLVSGYRHPGAIAGLLVGLVLLPRWILPGVPLALIADCLAPAVALAAAAMRVGCFTIGCCAGTLSHVPWAVHFPAESRVSALHAQLGWIESSALPSLAVHPLQLYFLALGVGVGCFLLWFESRKAFNGQVFLLFLAVHETGKGMLEIFRQDLPFTGATSVGVVSVAVGLLAAAALVLIPAASRQRQRLASKPTLG